jgi:sugar (pentulose or hexulose) kinase
MKDETCPAMNRRENTMPDKPLIAIGLDMGTGGARAVAVDLAGRVVARSRSDLPADAVRVDGPIVEQDPKAWIETTISALGQLARRLPEKSHVVGISLDATSGTFLFVDKKNHPLTSGIMYNDLRAADQAEQADEALRDELAPFGIRVAPAFALPKILHIARREPKLFKKCARIMHQTDYLAWFLTGRNDVTDISTALKTGANPATLTWPDALEHRFGIRSKLPPEIVLPGTPIGKLKPKLFWMGLPPKTPVIAGCTDGTAGCLASGARSTGDLNVTLGTTLVFKAIAETPLIDPQGAIYNHRHPAGGFLPGAASSTGGDWVKTHFPDTDLDALGRQAAALLPTDRLAYPLVKRGERFPFAHPEAAGFGLDEVDLPAERFAAGMEGVAYLERLGIERLEALGLTIGPTVYATGGGAASRTWLSIRAAVNRRTYSVPAEPECAVGAAVLAAAPHVGGCEEAVAAIVRAGERVEPDSALAEAYDERFERFRAALQQRGYL